MKKLFTTLMSSLILTGMTFAQSAPSATKEAVIDTYYYENSTIEFAEGVDMVKYEPIKPNTEFKLKDGNVEVSAILRLDKPFKTKGMIIDIYDENDDLYDTFDIEIDESWDFTSFKINFDATGHFFIDVYTSDDIFINSGELDIQ